MPFGMVNSSASFATLMKMILSDLEDFADAFIDDIIIFSETWFDHLKHITEVLSVLRRASAKPSKCMFAFQQIEFLTHVVGNGEVHPTQEKIAAIQNIPAPKTKKHVRSFIGVIGLYRRFIPHFANKSAVLTDLTAKDMPNKVKWTSVHQDAFDSLKQALVSYPSCKIQTLRVVSFYRLMLVIGDLDLCSYKKMVSRDILLYSSVTNCCLENSDIVQWKRNAWL